MMPGTGPYEIDISQTTQENNGIIVLKRRTDYWAIDHDRNIGINNFGESAPGKDVAEHFGISPKKISILIKEKLIKTN